MDGLHEGGSAPRGYAAPPSGPGKPGFFHIIAEYCSNVEESLLELHAVPMWRNRYWSCMLFQRGGIATGAACCSNVDGLHEGGAVPPAATPLPPAALGNLDFST